MLNVLLTSVTGFVITLLAIPAIIRVADEKKLFDTPDARKLHSRSISSLGGIGIFIGYFLSVLICVSYSHLPQFQYFFAAAIVIFFLGLKDDILILSASKKFLGQLAAAAILIHQGGVRIDSMHGFLGINELPALVSLALSYFTILVIINAYNLIDGVDGLAASLGIVSSACFGTYFVLAGMPAYAVMSFALTGSLLAFICFNFHPAKIFMGDSGSLMVGLINAIIAIRFIKVASDPSMALPLSSSIAISFAILIVPLLDTLRVFSTRIFRGKSPFSPDRNHIHHLLLDRGLSHKQVAISCAGLNIAFISMAFLGRSLGSTVLLLAMVASFYAIVGALVMFKKVVPKLAVAKPFQTVSGSAMQNTSKVVSIKGDAVAAEQ